MKGGKQEEKQAEDGREDRVKRDRAEEPDEERSQDRFCKRC